jgi:hypothetical protein
MDDVTFDGDVRRALALSASGVRLRCPRCAAVLVVAADLTSANEHRVHPGIYCPTSKEHVSVMLNLTATRRLLEGIGGDED